MKVFISQPMKGRSDSEILSERNEIADTFDDAEFIDSFSKDPAPDGCNEAIWKLGKAIQLMSQADVVVFAPGWIDARGCRIEYKIAEDYGIQIATFDIQEPDRELIDLDIIQKIEE